ncbi:MAG: hypothetical protein ACTSW7_01140 [Candidatus Thorarchaeota archaeon]|nr:hypothetical protein [Thermoplasmatales archaeon]
MAQQDLGSLRDRAQLYSGQINSESLSVERSTGLVPTSGFRRADIFVDFTRSVVDEIRIQHKSTDYIEQVKDESALPVFELKDLQYKKTITENKKFKFSIDLNSEYTELIFNALSAAVESVVFSGSGLDDASSSGIFTGSDPVEYLVEIDGTGTPDTFRWSKDGGSTWAVSTVAITGAPQLLDDGVSIAFAATTGHTNGDQWTIRAGYGSSGDLITVDVSLR